MTMMGDLPLIDLYGREMNEPIQVGCGNAFQQYQEIRMNLQNLLQTEPKNGVEMVAWLKMVSDAGKQAEGLIDTNTVEAEENKENHNQEDQVLGWTGFCLNESQEVMEKDTEELFGFNLQALPKVEPLTDVMGLLKQCQTIVKELQGKMDAKKFLELVELEDAMMVKLRKHCALYVGGLVRNCSKELTELHFCIHKLFTDTYHLMSGLGEGQKELAEQVITCGWIWENGPSPSVLAAATLKDISIRLYGLPLTAIKVPELTMCVMQETESALQKLEIKQKIRVDNSSAEKDGLVLKASQVSLEGMKQERKRNSEPKIYRLCCSIQVKLKESSVNVECISTPFTVRTGSPQLWPYTAHIIWYLWTQDDVREPDRKCPKEIESESVLGLIQARINGAELRPEPSHSMDGYRRLTDGERRGWMKILKDKYNTSSRMRRDVFTKMQKSDPCLWTLIHGAVNTGLRLKENDMEMYYSIGLSQELCTSAKMRHGEFLLRSSLSRLEHASGKDPFTKVVFEVSSGSKVYPVVVELENLEKYSLKDVVGSFHIEERGNNSARWILPGKIDVREMPTKKSTTAENSGIGYKKVTKQEPMPPETLITSVLNDMTLSPAYEAQGASMASPSIFSSASKSPKLTSVAEDDLRSPCGSVMSVTSADSESNYNNNTAVYKEKIHRDKIRAYLETSDDAGAPMLEGLPTASNGIEEVMAVINGDPMMSSVATNGIDTLDQDCMPKGTYPSYNSY